MNVKITSVHSAGEFKSALVGCTVDGLPYSVFLHPFESCVYAFGTAGDACVTTHKINAPDLLDAVVNCLAGDL